VLSSALGLQKSFSTSDISQLPSPEETPHQPPPRCAVSELALSSVQRSGYLLDHPRLDHASRSCSTWVAVGDVASTSQLPSPLGGHNTTAPAVSTPPAFTAADLIRSVNKKVLYFVSSMSHSFLSADWLYYLAKLWHQNETKFLN
jgi:hypothetical protein